MKYYQAITLVADDWLFFALWRKVYPQLPIALVDGKNQHGIDGIGISFPHYNYEAKRH